jgi:hypothetical protein
VKVSNRHWRIAVLLLGSLLIFPASASSEEPTSPFGQSNSFAFNTNRIGFGETAIMQITNVPEGGVVPSVTSLGSPMPNPFNPSITISFNVGQAGNIDLNIYDLGGRLIKTLATQEFEVGQYSRRWDGRDHNASMMPAGVYLVRIQGKAATDSKKITLVK